MASESGDDLQTLAMYAGGAAALLAGAYFAFGRGDKAPGGAAASGGSSSNSSASASKPAEEAKAEEPTNQYPAGPLSVYFGSQTGTAEGFAKDLVDEGKRRGFDAQLVDLEDFESDQMTECGVGIFLMATYGEGEPTDNAQAFYQWLKDDDEELGGETLENVKFTVFGLGNRQYEHYNYMGTWTDERLAAVGAGRCFRKGEGDDDGTLEEDFEAWKEELWPALVSKFHPDGAAAAGGDDDGAAVAKPELEFTVAMMEGAGEEAVRSRASSSFDANEISASTRHFFEGFHHSSRLVESRELRRGENVGSTLHVELEIKGTPIDYGCADNLAILAENDPAVVEGVAAALGYDLDAVFRLNPVAPGAKPNLPSPCTVRKALTMFLDLASIPNRSMLRNLSAFAGETAEAARLVALAGKGGSDEFKQWIGVEARTLAELITVEFPSLEIPLEYLIHMTPRLQPRYYTISSTPTVHPDRVHVTASVLRAAKPGGDGTRVHNGVCTTYLERLSAAKLLGKDARCDVFVRPSTFDLPRDPSIPIVMCGPGTGFAPMRAFLQERRHQRQQGAAVGETVLYFGCRRRGEDFIYEDEVMSYTQDGTITSLHTAFSREQSEKVYVQTLMGREENGAELWDLLDAKGGHFYVCGGTGMGTDVMNAVIAVCEARGGMTKDAATAYVKKMQADGRYVQELWS